jgi:hypothetical protein
MDPESVRKLRESTRKLVDHYKLTEVYERYLQIDENKYFLKELIKTIPREVPEKLSKDYKTIIDFYHKNY